MRTQVGSLRSSGRLHWRASHSSRKTGKSYGQPDAAVTTRARCGRAACACIGAGFARTGSAEANCRARGGCG